MPLIIDSARVRREHPFIMEKLFEFHKLKEGTGLNWDEFEATRLTAQTVTDTTDLQNAQELGGTLRSFTPTMSGITTIMTKNAQGKMSANVASQLGKLAEQAILRKVDQDLLTVLDGATTSNPGAATTLAHGHLAAMVTSIRGNTTEGADGPIRIVLHSFQKYDIEVELEGGIGTYPVPSGISEKVFSEGFEGRIHGAGMWVDDNITIDAASDAKGGAFAEKGGLYIRGFGERHYSKELPNLGGGSDQMWIYREYIGGERLPNGSSVFVHEVYSDATQPTA